MDNFDFNSLNESWGIKEFNNDEFENLIKSIPQQFLYETNKTKEFLVDKHTIKFYKLDIQLNLSWIKNLQIFYTYNDIFYYYFQTYGISPNVPLNSNSENSVIENEIENLYIEKNDCIITTPILLYIDKNHEDFIKFYSSIIYHEIAHLYDRIKCKSNTGLDIEFARNNEINHDRYQLIKMRLINNRYSLNDLKYIINEFIENTNYSEAHAYTESSYFDMLLYMEDLSLISWKLMGDYSQKNILKNISNKIGDIYEYTDIIKKLIDNRNPINIRYKKLYLNELNARYNKNFISVNDLLKYYYKHLLHIKNNIDKSFSYFYKLFNVNKQIEKIKMHETGIKEIRYNISKNKYKLEYVLIGNEIKKHYIRK